MDHSEIQAQFESLAARLDRLEYILTGADKADVEALMKQLKEAEAGLADEA